MPRPPRGQATVTPVCLIDDDNNRFTTAAFAVRGDWWWGATILTRPESVQRLLDAGRSLREVDPSTGQVISKIVGVRLPKPARRRWWRR
jgi:hypothetical protein